MIRRTTKTNTDSPSLMVRAESHFAKLVQDTSDQQLIVQLGSLRQLLEQVLIGQADFGLATNRISNAMRYLNSGERGAAQYEIRLLINDLRRQLELYGHTLPTPVSGAGEIQSIVDVMPPAPVIIE